MKYLLIGLFFLGGCSYGKFKKGTCFSVEGRNKVQGIILGVGDDFYIVSTKYGAFSVPSVYAKNNFVTIKCGDKKTPSENMFMLKKSNK